MHIYILNEIMIKIVLPSDTNRSQIFMTECIAIELKELYLWFMLAKCRVTNSPSKLAIDNSFTGEKETTQCDRSRFHFLVGWLSLAGFDGELVTRHFANINHRYNS